MKTLEELKSYEFQCMDGRDIHRVMQFLTIEEAIKLGVEFKDDAHIAEHKPIEFTRDNILKQLKNDVEFGFDKALDQRGISSSLMYHVVKLWNWVLEEGLEDFTSYAQYGLPLFKATAIKYGWENHIGDDSGSESKYSSD